MSKYLTTTKAKEATNALGFKVSPPMICPINKNKNEGRNKMEVVISDIMPPCMPKCTAMTKVHPPDMMPQTPT